MTITLEPELEAALDREAQLLGKPPEELALQTLRRNYLPTALPEEILSGGTLFNTLQNILDTLPRQQATAGTSHLSERTGEEFTNILLEKQAEERKRYGQWLKEQKAQEGAQT